MDRVVRERGPLFARMAVQTLLSLMVMGAILFLAAGDWRWSQAWVFLVEIGVLSFAVSVWLLRHDPALLASRLGPPLQRDQEQWDRIFMVVLLVAFVAWMMLIGLDARRFRWSVVPVWGHVLGASLIASCMLLCWQVFRFNTFAAPQVKVQPGRAQQVITEGPYRVVRHPMYASGSMLFIGMPLRLGSWWGLLAASILIVVISTRIVGKERMLRRELSGYDDYAKQVRYRLVPGLW
jgi:protein-S-isoprenylcysteine O-methyltransferase Ste14